MLQKIRLTIFSILILTGSELHAQASSTGSLMINSDPVGAEVLLEGESTVTGMTPALFRYPLIGKYKLTIRRYGYETYKTTITVDPSKETVLNVKLVAKSRFKAAIRSVFIPGWGQRYSGQEGKGFVFTLLAAVSVGSYFIVDNDFDKKLNNYTNSLQEYDDALSSGADFDQLQRMLDDLEFTQDEAFDAENKRRFSIGAVVGIWSLSIVDAFLFFPDERSTMTIKGIAVKPDYGFNHVGITLSRRF